MTRSPARRRLPLSAAALATILIGLSAAPFTGEAAAQGPRSSIDTTLLKTYRWRALGPNRGGRSIAVSGVKGRPREAYFGATGGGLWKTRSTPSCVGSGSSRFRRSAQGRRAASCRELGHDNFA